MIRTRAVLGLAFLLAVGAIVVTVVLQQRADDSRGAQLKLASVKIELNRLQGAPFQSATATGGSPELARKLMRDNKSAIRGTLAELQAESPPAALNRLSAVLGANFATLERIYAIGVATNNYGRRADQLAGVAGGTADRATGQLDAASRVYADRASRATNEASVGAAAAILLLLVAFSFYFLRSAGVAQENKRLLLASREEALHDSLTSLRNRRALLADLEAKAGPATPERPLVLMLFDLDGFKHYNDNFGHPAGDVLLARLGERLAAAAVGLGTAYRLGGDEFCLLAYLEPGEADVAARLGADALCESGKGFEIACSYGVVAMPNDASTTEDALRLADQRMYAQKAVRSQAGRQSTDALLQVLSERSVGLSEHVSRVAGLAEAVARSLSLPGEEVTQIRLAAELHDIGKSGIPDEILNKPGALNDKEWAFMRRHTMIGERIILAAPALRESAKLVRSSHEYVNGEGYPDGLSGSEIPLGARIIAACDAYDAMTSDRPYRRAISVPEALTELRACAGSQFDPLVVRMLCQLLDRSQRWTGGFSDGSPIVQAPADDSDGLVTADTVPTAEDSDRFSW